MKLTYHIGLCCGIKTVHGFYYRPDSIIPATKQDKPGDWGKDKFGYQVSSTESFWFGEAPAETYKERLQRFIAFMHKHRPNNVLEAVIVPEYGADENDEDDDEVDKGFQNRWIPVLEELGFKMVTEALNSNSGNVIQIWHLVITPENDPAKPSKASPNPFR